MDNYREQAEKFLNKSDTKINITYIGDTFSDWDKENRHATYSVTLSNKKHSYTFNFWDSLHNTENRWITFDEYYNKNYRNKKTGGSYGRSHLLRKYKELQEESRPNAYIILSDLTPYMEDTFQDFCDCFGYDTDSRKALDIYLKVQEEYNNLTKLFTSRELEELAEIQ